MKHLAPEEFVDLLDGTLEPDRARHLDGCTTCRQQADDLRAMAAEVTGVETPEPSPLFWDHLSARVRQAAVESPAVAPAMMNWRRWPAWVLAGGAGAVVLLAILTGMRAMDRPGPRTADSGSVETARRPGGNAGDSAADWGAARLLADGSVEPAWDLVLSMAESIEWDDDAAIELVSGGRASERTFFRLSAEERLEFARVLEAELAEARGTL